MSDVALIKTFIEISKTRHFGKVANTLHITQSAVSARVRLLEETIGVKLLTRDRNNIQLTPAGMRFLPFAESMLITWSRALQETALGDDNKILLVIGAVHSLWETDLKELAIRSRRLLPNLALQIEAHSPNVLLSMIAENALDIAFMFQAPQLVDLKSEYLGSLDLVMVTSHAGLAAEEAINRSDYIMVDWGSSFSAAHAQQFPDATPSMLRVSHGYLALGYLLNAGGTAYMARNMVTDELKQNKLYLVDDAPSIERKYYAVNNLKGSRTDAVQSIINLHKQNSLAYLPADG